MQVEFFISLRYLFTRRKEKFVSIISLISVLGIAIGVMALIVVIAVMTGFDRDLHDKIIGNYSHITVSSYNAIDSEDIPVLSDKIKKNPNVKGLSPFIQGQAILKEDNKYFAVNLKGIDPIGEREVTKIDQYLVDGKLEELNKGGIIIGKELASYFGLQVGSNLLLYSPLGKQFNLKVVGIFNSGMYDYDMNLVFSNLANAQEILGLGNKVSALAIKLNDYYLADKVIKELYPSLGFNYIFKTWMDANRNFFAALKLEKLVMFIILTLIILVASFNIISTLIVMVMQKTRDIGILKALGMNNAAIKRIFALEGLLIGGIGTFLGVSGGIILCLLLKKYQFIKLPQDIYYIDHLPVAIAFWPDMFLIILASMGIVFISTIYPAKKASRLNPAEALRYE